MQVQIAETAASTVVAAVNSLARRTMHAQNYAFTPQWWER